MKFDDNFSKNNFLILDFFKELLLGWTHVPVFNSFWNFGDSFRNSTNRNQLGKSFWISTKISWNSVKNCYWVSPGIPIGITSIRQSRIFPRLLSEIPPEVLSDILPAVSFEVPPKFLARITSKYFLGFHNELLLGFFRVSSGIFQEIVRNLNEEK